MTRATWLLLVLLLAPTGAPGEERDETTLLPGVSIRLSAARYAPVETDLHWVGWIGAGVELFQLRGTAGFLDGDLETILGDTLRPFEANQANYHLAFGARRAVGEIELTAFFHHVSRHLVDRSKTQAVDWNILGVRAAARLPPESFLPVRAELGLGRVTLASLVGYRWELTGRVEGQLLRRDWGELYALADGRLVLAEDTPAFPRGSFVDASLEAGIRWTRERRFLELFLAYEHRNDVLIETPASRSRALLGLRFGMRRRQLPAAPEPATSVP
jgi:hypothetical protein